MRYNKEKQETKGEERGVERKRYRAGCGDGGQGTAIVRETETERQGGVRRVLLMTGSVRGPIRCPVISHHLTLGVTLTPRRLR